MSREPPKEALDMFKGRYSVAKRDGIKRPDAKAMAKSVASDYLCIYEQTGWTWNELFRAILSVAGRKAAVAKVKKKEARRRRDRDLGGQLYFPMKGGVP